MFFCAGIYIGWVGYQNLGDEAMWDVCVRRFPRIHWSVYKQLQEQPGYQQFLSKSKTSASYFSHTIADNLANEERRKLLWNLAVYRLARLGGEVGILGGGTLINDGDPYLNAYIAARKRTGRPVPVFGSGVVSPEFGSPEPGWTDRRKDWAVLFQELPVVGVRGPLSKALLEDAGAANIIISGDPAVRFHRRTGIDADGHIGPLRIGINCGEGARGWTWGSTGLIRDGLSSTARALMQMGHEVRLLAVWPKDLSSCTEVARQAGLPQSAIAPALYLPNDYMREVSKLDLLVALKLHAAVLSAAANVPFVALEYSPKCLDFAMSIGWERFNLRTSELTGAKLLDIITGMLSELPALRGQLCESMCKISGQFEEYCGRIQPLLVAGSSG